MKWNVDTTVEFFHMAKPLWKKYKSLMDDLENLKKELEENPFQGDMLTPGIRKIRMAITSKGGGKSKGARIITLTYSIDETNGNIVLLLIYDFLFSFCKVNKKTNSMKNIMHFFEL